MILRNCCISEENKAQFFHIKKELQYRKLLRLAAEDSGINEKLFAGADEDVKKFTP